jgi:hypothetical protein
MSRLGFEFGILEKMSPGYRDAVTNSVGLDVSEIAVFKADCPLKLPEQLASSVEVYAGFLGNPFSGLKVGYEVPAELGDSQAICFSLTLWPHLLWVVHQQPNGRCWEVGFQQALPKLGTDLEPAVVRPGIWTRSTLQRLSDKHELYDGWDEHAVVRFEFGTRCYEGTFTFGLLDSWRKL